MKYFAGIGSRATPKDIIPEIERLATILINHGYILRSGGAPGADSFWENAYKKGKKEIFLPHENFNDNISPLFEQKQWAEDIAKKFHPDWSRLSEFGIQCMTRNSYQVLGYDNTTPSEFIVCWTKEGKLRGGTAQAMRLCKYYKIPIYNLAIPKDGERLENYLHQNQIYELFQ